MFKKASCMRVFSLFNSRWDGMRSWLSTPTNGLRIKTLGEFKPHFLAAYEAMPATDLSARSATDYAPLQRFVDRLSMVMGHVGPGSSAALARSNSLRPGLPAGAARENRAAEPRGSVGIFEGRREGRPAVRKANGVREPPVSA